MKIDVYYKDTDKINKLCCPWSHYLDIQLEYRLKWYGEIYELHNKLMIYSINKNSKTNTEIWCIKELVLVYTKHRRANDAPRMHLECFFFFTKTNMNISLLEKCDNNKKKSGAYCEICPDRKIIPFPWNFFFSLIKNYHNTTPSAQCCSKKKSQKHLKRTTRKFAKSMNCVYSRLFEIIFYLYFVSVSIKHLCIQFVLQYTECMNLSGK